MAQRKVVIFVGIYVLVALLAFGGLLVHVRTIPLNDQIQQMTLEIERIQLENRDLNLRLLDRTSLDIVDQAAQTIGLAPPEHIVYLDVPTLNANAGILMSVEMLTSQSEWQPTSKNTPAVSPAHTTPNVLSTGASAQ